MFRQPDFAPQKICPSFWTAPLEQNKPVLPEFSIKTIEGIAKLGKFCKNLNTHMISQKIINKKITSYVSGRADIALTVLFGSRARGTETEKSDIDIGILYETPDLLTLGSDIMNIEQLTGIKTDAIILNGLPAEKPQFAHEIAQEAILLFAQDENIFYTFKTNCFLCYFDFLPLLTQSKKALAERIKNGLYAEPIYAKQA